MQHFRWPNYGKEITEELLSVSVYNCSKFFSNRLLGQLFVSLQHVVTSGKLLLREPLSDANYSLTDIIIELDIRFHPLEGIAGHWEGMDFLEVEDSDESALVIRNDGFDNAERGSIVALNNQMERDARQLGRSLIRMGDEDEDDEDYDYEDDLVEMETSDIILTPLRSRCRPLSRTAVAAMPRVQSFQVNVNILQAQKLVGVNINPAVFIRVGGQKKHTATQKSTNCPFYSENFQFEFQEAPQMFFDKVIEIKVFHRRTLAFLMTHIGTFKIDISTVYSQPDHRFYQKWAPLTDPTDTRSGVKGYVQASLSVLMKGDAPHMPGLPVGTSSGSSEDIEKHLLLPRGMPFERPWARFRVKIYRADGLPTMEAGLMAKMSVTDRAVFIDPYAQVIFAGQQGETSVASATSYPVWNEEISFIEQFPPLAQRIKIQLLDDAKMGDIALATHFLDLQQISDPTRNGFNPTFGPCWVNLYGSPQNSTLGDIHQALNEGLGEGILYRGRILLALSMDLYSSPSAIPTNTGSVAATKVKGAQGKFGLKKKKNSKKEKTEANSATSELADESEEAGVEVPESVTVEVEEIHPLPEGYLGQKEEFLLFASLFEVTMIDPVVGTKPLTFELSIGNYGKAVGVGKSKKSQSREELRKSRENLTEETHGLLGSEDELEREEMTNSELENRSVSSAMRPQPTEYDRSFKCIQLQPPAMNLKPCLYVWSQFEDHSFRLYQANWLSKMADRLETGLNQVEHLLRRPKSKAKERLIEVLLELVTCCKQFSAFSDKRSQSRPNSLDKCRREFIKKNLDCNTTLKKLSECRRSFKEAVSSLPEEFMPMYEEEEETQRQLLPVEERRKIPISLSCQDCRYFQLRCHLYQGRGLLAADDDGLSDPFARVIFSTQCQVTRGSPKPLGRAYAEPEFKTVEQFYEKPRLQFYDVSRGRIPAGELLAAFELIELDYSAFGEVLFWGLRELKRVHLFEVERPKVKVECGGKHLESEEIQSYKNNPNFKEVVRYIDVVCISFHVNKCS
ncbi:hypothetical protein XENOCAPTIV_028903 [Xenoophorus captivus]|uniref:C2 domain-containing protein n=1 Tax=Xenoophorus captivus TaxID=1517983 RepID=A0ABV0QF34_9TELE